MRFLLPRPIMPSGGHVYNRQVLEDPWPGPLQLEPCYVEPDLSAPALAQLLSGDMDDWVFWDSLLLDRIAEVADLRRSKRHALLVHYLPSRDPLLTRAEQAAVQLHEDLAARSVEAFIATGQGIGRELRLRYPGKPAFVCEPGVDPAFRAARGHRSSRRGRSLNLLTVANLVPAKGHIRILTILKRLPDLHWCWHLVGDSGADPAFASQWLEEVARSGLGERIHCRGPLPQGELAALMEDMDIFLSASSCESYGMALAEAVAAGLPALTTRVGEAERIMCDGLCGHVVDRSDWSRFEELLRKMLEDPALRESMALMEPMEPVRTWHATREEFAAACRAILALPPIAASWQGRL